MSFPLFQAQIGNLRAETDAFNRSGRDGGGFGGGFGGGQNTSMPANMMMFPTRPTQFRSPV
jgi:hypothetical protein